MTAVRDISHLTSTDLAPLESRFDHAYPEQLRDVATSLFVQLLEEDDLEIDGGRRAELALALTERLSQDHGGRGFYMNKGTSFRLTPRNRRMCEEFRGNNYSQLARKYDLSEMRVRQIVDEWRQQQYLLRQGQLELDQESD